MELRKIRQMAKLMEETGLTALELTSNGETIKLERQNTGIPVPAGTAPLFPFYKGKKRLWMKMRWIKAYLPSPRRWWASFTPPLRR